MDADIIIAKSHLLIETWLGAVFSLFSTQSPWLGLTWWQIYIGVGAVVLSIWVIRHFAGLGWRQVDTAVTARPEKPKPPEESKKSTKKE